MLARLFPLLRRFRDDTRASVMMELIFAAILTNMILAAFFVWWDAFQAKSRVEKTAYTISDLISRQRAQPSLPAQLTRPFIDGLERTAEFLLMEDQNARMRVSQIRRTSGVATSTAGLVIDWSYSPCNAMPAIGNDPAFNLSMVPLLAVGSAVIVVELVVPFEPEYTIGISPTTFTRRVIALPRFEQSFTHPTNPAGTSTCIN